MIVSLVLATISLLFIAVGVVALVKVFRRRREELERYRPSEIAEELSDSKEQGAEQASAPPTETTDASSTTATHKPAAQPLQLTHGLKRSRESFWGRFERLLKKQDKVDEALAEELESVLLSCDLGVGLSMRLMDQVRALRCEPGQDLTEQAQALLRAEIRKTLAPCDGLASPLDIPSKTKRPWTILFVGVNGVGKTTTVGKLAWRLGQKKLKVTLCAGDTFRAAAAEQLEVWAERAQARLIRSEAQADPASVMFNAMQSAVAQDDDVMLADTAGRLHNKADLMAEIAKIRRVLSRHRDGAPDEVWLVVDATTGQNAILQAEQFHEAVGLTGVVLTKLDGSAKGGVAIGIVDKLKIPIRLIGLGEKAEMLEPFDADAFVQALF